MIIHDGIMTIVAIILSIIIINRLELVIEFQYNVPVARNVIGIILEIEIFIGNPLLLILKPP